MILIICGIITLICIIVIFATHNNSDYNIITDMAAVILTIAVIIGFVVLGILVPVKRKVTKTDFSYSKSKNYILIENGKLYRVDNDITIYNQINDSSKVYIVKGYNSYGMLISEELKLQEELK